MSDKKFSSLKARGHTFLCDPDTGLVETDTVQCVHCGMHWNVDPYNAKGRGFCGRCNGPVCGPKCCECVPMEKWLDCVEKGKDPKTIVTVRGGWGSR